MVSNGEEPHYLQL